MLSLRRCLSASILLAAASTMAVPAFAAQALPIAPAVASAADVASMNMVEVHYPVHHRVNRKEARRIVRRQGYALIKSIERRGDRWVVRASRTKLGAHTWRIVVSARNGRILSEVRVR
ncbi:hypothetical protein E1162_04680 [Rhodobacteraceae bacterium RKSG542]|uniref:hypothetical protein n=1 Tax=Pseudovibrio flavus TaxID=2529854 RepID=UPI0012BCA1FD|nr:hypothetical protein [Pseudovibrio flavus]MTI16533.1 hypothetical protein [Pseudovibrio flavus]